MIGDGRTPWPLVTADGMRARDRYTIETLGIPSEILMEHAGRAVAEGALELGAAERGLQVVCGAGNNGGDGLVAARLLHCAGVDVEIVLVGSPEKLKGDAAANWARAGAMGVRRRTGLPELRSGGVAVDALFGTGLSRAIEGDPAKAVEALCRGRAEAGLCVLAVDLPSGLSADTGQPLGPCVEADLTVTLGLPKRGLALEPGRSLAGRIRVARIGIVDMLPDEGAGAELWPAGFAASLLPERPRAGHKGSFGHVLVVAGSEGKTGAATLAALGAGRAGAGLVTVACPAGVDDVLEVKCTEAMTAPMPETPGRAFARAALEPLRELAAARDVVALGPGIGTADETRDLVRALLPRLEKPVVIDADGLNALAGDLGPLKARKAPTIVTPHPGEAARLLGNHAGEINRDRIGAARALAERSLAIVVLKGAATVVAAPDGRVAVSPTGGPLLATGGTGDVLTGVVAGLLAQGLAPFEAAALGVWLHGAAADLLAERIGSAGALAGDVAGALPETMEGLRRAAASGSRRDGSKGRDREGRTGQDRWAGDGGHDVERTNGLAPAFPEP